MDFRLKVKTGAGQNRTGETSVVVQFSLNLKAETLP